MSKKKNAPSVDQQVQSLKKQVPTHGGKLKKNETLLEKEEEFERLYRLKSEESFMAFTRGLTIASAHGPRLFEGVMAQFQRDCFEDVCPAIEAIRNGDMPEKRRFWIERTKKASKDADLAVILLWLLAFPTRPLYIQVGAGNKEQAAIVKDRVVHLLHWNPWLNDHVEIIQWEIRSKMQMADGSPMAKLQIMSSDISGAHGGIPDLLVINELTHVTKWEFAETLMDNADGVARGVVIIATNAGFKGTQAEIWRNNALLNWSVHCLSQPAPWHDKATIKDARRRLPYSRYKRLWEGIWASGRGEAVDEATIEQAFTLSGPLLEPEPGWSYLAGLDLGISHDHSAFAIIGVHPFRQLVKLAYWEAWKPTRKYGKKEKNGEVDLMDVEKVCVQYCRKFSVSALFFDPYQAKLMAQRLRKQGIYMKEVSFNSQPALEAMATSFISLMESGKFACYDDAENRVKNDFNKFDIMEKSYGFRLVAVRDTQSHADVGTAIILALPAAVEMMNGTNDFSDVTNLIETNVEMIDGDERKQMNEELRDLYALEEEIEEDYSNYF